MTDPDRAGDWVKGAQREEQRWRWGSAWVSLPRSSNRFPRRPPQRTSGRSLTGLGTKPAARHSRSAGSGKLLEQVAEPGPNSGPETDPFRASKAYQAAPKRHRGSESRHNHTDRLRRRRLGAIPGLAQFVLHSGKCSPVEGVEVKKATPTSGPFIDCFCKMLVHA